ncbi:DUF262 domain-containing protein [Allocoleopsis franciscana]|uniref:GmrSD restriction endonucleases N-terminal domain-containing protein n=1 Tax=Allocoleopsis franciscana PCC 7113 TaxID=1173027 RepID=K9WK36_9CYAN|nr:DUF262 domain-containing protein [Allocoleopsis franciscana]AFZ20166.1 Protein of unknown function DUF262 [Allocoleopsis franciscana PCC 7113]
MTELKNRDRELLDEDTLDEEDIDEQGYEASDFRYDPEKINIVTREPTIEQLLRRINEDALNLAPEFQRQANIWKPDVKSRLIESILIRIPLPAFYIDATNEEQWLVVDGLQRLSALKQFVSDKSDKKLKLCGLEYLKELDGKTYDQLERRYQRRIEETQVTVYLIEKGTPPEVKNNIFKRINTGGMPLSPQELRHALNPGKATQLLAKLAQSREFKQSTDITDRSKSRMVDRELVLRFLAFTINCYKDYDAKILDDFLNDTMVRINHMSQQEVDTLEQKFIQAMNTAFDIFAKYAFRKRSKESIQKKYRLNKALFEVWSVILGQLSEREIQILKEKKQDLVDNFINLLEDDEDFQISISQSTSKVSQVNYRFSTIERLVEKVLA